MKVDFSIVIPFKGMDSHVRTCIDGCLKLGHEKYEIILLPDSPIKWKHAKCVVLPTGPVKPSVKRNIAAKAAKGSILAFIDSDAYPERLWLSNAVKTLKEGTVGIVGGPNVLPPGSSLMQKAGDDVLSSRLGGGYFSFRYRKRGSAREVGELPTCNMLVRKELFMKIGGFDESLLTAEDAKFCFQARNLGKKIIYLPDVLVYHHRRPLFLPHAKQMWRYGRDKAVVLKCFFSPGKMLYLAPAFFVLFITLGLAASVMLPFENVRAIYTYLCSIYTVIILTASIIASPKRFLLVLPGIFITHISYGLGFIRGLILG